MFGSSTIIISTDATESDRLIAKNSRQWARKRDSQSMGRNLEGADRRIRQALAWFVHWPTEIVPV